LLTPQVAKKLLKIRDNLVSCDAVNDPHVKEAYYQLYLIADPDNEFPYQPWNALEELAEQESV